MKVVGTLDKDCENSHVKALSRHHKLYKICAMCMCIWCPVSFVIMLIIKSIIFVFFLHLEDNDPCQQVKCHQGNFWRMAIPCMLYEISGFGCIAVSWMWDIMFNWKYVYKIARDDKDDPYQSWEASQRPSGSRPPWSAGCTPVKYQIVHLAIVIVFCSYATWYLHL